MKIKNSPFYPDGNVNFNVEYKELTYKVNIKFFPFKLGLTETNILESELEQLCIPIAHVELKVLDIDTSIYRSHYLMPHNALYIMKEMKNASINMWVARLVMETGFEKRMDDYLNERQLTAQLSLF